MLGGVMAKMQFGVFVQVAGIRKCSGAVAALQGFVATVGPQVYLQSVPSRVELPTVVAHVLAFRRGTSFSIRKSDSCVFNLKYAC